MLNERMKGLYVAQVFGKRELLNRFLCAKCARARKQTDAEKYVDGEDEVIDFETIVNEVALLRNKWLGIMKGLESKNFMLGHITRLRTAGMEDASID